MDKYYAPILRVKKDPHGRPGKIQKNRIMNIFKELV